MNAGAFGNPDPLFARYYFAMSWWVRLIGNSSLVTLRAFSLLVAGLGVLITVVILLRKHLTPLQRIVGIVIMLGFSSFVRTSHNLRMDVGLGVYGAILLWGLLEFLENRRTIWVIVLGGALLLGMELIPPLTLVINGVIGFLLIGFALAKQLRWRLVFLYAGLCALGVLIYAAIQFLPDVAQNLHGYSEYMTAYYSGGPGFDFTHILNFLRISFSLSPVEIIVVSGVLVLAWRTDRVLAAFVGVSLLLTMSIRSASYGYLTVFAPFIAYLAARTFRSQVVITLGAFLLIPAFISAPIYDMSTAVNLQTNRRTIEEVDLLSWRVPEGSTVWGDTVFWFTLHDRVNFIGWYGPLDIARAEGTTMLDVVKQLGVDVIICSSENPTMCSIGQELFGDPYEFNVTNAHYLMYSRLGSH